MQISAKTGYAVRALLSLAAHAERISDLPPHVRALVDLPEAWRPR